MDYNENKLDTESDDDDEEDEGESSGSDEDESGDDDDGSGYESVDEIIETVPGEGAENAEGLNYFSSDDDPEKESCPICLNKFIGQDLGFPESCDHTFCFECIKEWSKNINTCPIDRTEFNYIHVKDSDGTVLRKVKVSVAPKEPEASLEETPTLCEICQSGDREDRLLLCDGCDLAFHCECLDPPLFYIPIEEWFCPACSGVFDSRAISGPSRSGTRRVIPRTRASETVRSRVQNLRTMRTPRSSSTSQSRKTKTQSAPKRRKSRFYRKVIRKVVTLARTKKDMNAGQKGKLGTRSSTVIITYRRRRKRYRRKRKVSKRSAASRQRIAIQLGIGKSLKSSTVAQTKMSTAGGSRSATITAKLPSHSLFGNKDQLMDFSENFNEDMRDASATSTSKTSKRSSTDACASTSSGISLLDSIMAGQKILQAKSDKILIKADGSLILKDDTKKQSNVRKIVNDPPSRTPMSIALAKQGVRTSLLDKNSSASCKKHADTSKLKNASDRKIPKSSNDTLSENRSSVSARSSSKLFNILSSDSKSCSNNERKNYLSTTKNGLGIKTKKAIVSEVDDFNSFTELDRIASDGPSNRDKTIDNNNKTNCLTVVSKTKNTNNQKLKICNNSVKTYQTKFDSLSDDFSTIASSSSSAISCKTSIESHIKREILSDEKYNNDSQTTNIQKVQIKQDSLSDEETNIDSWNEHSDIREQKFNDIIANIKKEPVDPDLNVDSIKYSKNLEVNKNVLSGSSDENNFSDFNDSQSIIDSVPYDVLNATQVNKLCKNTKLLKVKEEIPSDTEDYSQSLFLDSTSGNIDRLSHMKSVFSIKKEPFDSKDTKSSEGENACHQNKRANFIERLESRSVTFSSNLLENELPCTQAVASLSDSESKYDDLPCTQAFSQVPATDSEDETPSALVPSPAETDSEDDEIPSAQAPSHAATDSEDEIPCAQVSPHASTDSEDDEIPSAQAPSNAATDSEDEIPCAQVSPHAATDSENDEIPCTQTVSASTTANSEEDDDDIPCTQAAFIPTKICDKTADTSSSFGTNKLNSRKIADDILPPTQNVLCANKDADSKVSNTKKDFEFKKPSAISTKTKISTENSNASSRKSTRNSLQPSLSECELPSTQVATFSAPTNKNKDKSSNKISNNLKSVKSSSKEHNFDIDFIDDSSLPLTQVSSLNPKQTTNFSDTASRQLNLELSKVHATEIYDSNSQNIDELTVPETQIFKAISDKKILDSQPSVSSSESFNLPPTQIFNISDTEQNACVNDQILPHTQSICSNSKELCIGNENNEQDNDNCKENMSEIISNIKQIVNSLSSKVHENQNLQNISNEISNDELLSDFNNTLNYPDETLGSKNVLSEDKNVPFNNSKVSSINTEKENQSNVQSSDDSNDEEFSLEKFKESLKESKPVTPKKYGIHKHLPQVIATVPVKENVKIKPSNKRTFSFEEVVKLQKPSIQPKASVNFSSKSEIHESKMLENSEIDSNEDDSLPATQLVETVNKQYKSNLLQPQNNNFGTKKFINQELGNHLNEKSDFHSSSFVENDNFLAIQRTISEASEKNSHLLNEKTDSKSINFNNSSFQNPKRKLVQETVKDDFALPASITEDDFSDLCVTQRNGIVSSHNKNVETEKHPAINSSKKKLMTSKLDLSDNSDSSVDFIDSGDLPATQICNNLKSINSVRTYKLSNNNIEGTSVEIHQSKAFKSNKDLENCYLKNGYASKRKNSFIEITKNKKVCNQIADKSHSKKNNDIDINEQNANKACEKSLPSEIIYGLKENCARNNITIKQEKDDFEFVKPSLNAQIFNSSTSVSCLNLNVIKIEKIDPCDDFLPPTQAVNFTHLEGNSLPHTQVTNMDINKNMINSYSESIKNEFLSPSKIKKEPCSDDDDEISVIEVGTTSNVKVKEVILIDDDDDDDENYKPCLSNFDVIKGKEIPSERIDVFSIKKEKCLETRFLSESEPDMKNLKSTCEKLENFNKCSKDSKKKSDDSARSKHDNQNHKHIESKKNKKNSPESSISKKVDKNSKFKDIKNFKDPHTSKEKAMKNSFDSHASEEKSKRNSKDHHPGEKSKNPVSEGKNTNSKDLLPYHENNVHKLSKKSNYSKDSKPSKKEIKDSHNSQASCEKDSEKLKDDSCSKEKKIEMGVLKSQLKSSKSDSTNSASKNKVNMDQCGSHSKSTNSVAKHSEKYKDSSVNKSSSKSTNYQNSKIKTVTDKVEKVKQKYSEDIRLERKFDKSSDKDRKCSSEKENRNKNNKDVIIAVKAENKRSHNDTSDQYNQKKRKIGHSLDSESNSSEDVAIQLSDLQNDFDKYSNFSDDMQMECEGISNRLSSSKDIGNASELYSKPAQTADIKKITSKQDLKEEIANEVKQVLKPFYNTGLISKDDYKDIMRRAVPKIFMNCHKIINTEKIRKLVLNYVSLLNNRS